MLANGNPDPRGVDAHSAVWYATLHLVYTLDWNFSARASSWEPPPPFRKGDLDAGRLPPRTYTREELLSYVAYVHEKTRTTLAAAAADEATPARPRPTSADSLARGLPPTHGHFRHLPTFPRQHPP